MGDFNPFVSFATSTLKNGMHSRVELENIVRFHANDLKLTSGDPFKFLMAISGVESDFGKRCGARFEFSYGQNSLAFKRSSMLREGHEIWEDLAACSYGPHQIMWVVARELGYPLSSSPADLISAVVSMPYVVDLLNRNIEKGAVEMNDLALTYNRGLGALKDKQIDPNNYVKRFRFQYDQLDR